jgi:hypothetical protein
MAAVRKPPVPHAGSMTRSDGRISFIMVLRKLRQVQIGMVQFIESILKDEVSPCGISTKPGSLHLNYLKRKFRSSLAVNFERTKR